MYLHRLTTVHLPTYRLSLVGSDIPVYPGCCFLKAHLNFLFWLFGICKFSLQTKKHKHDLYNLQCLQYVYLRIFWRLYTYAICAESCPLVGTVIYSVFTYLICVLHCHQEHTHLRLPALWYKRKAENAWTIFSTTCMLLPGFFRYRGSTQNSAFRAS